MSENPSIPRVVQAIQDAISLIQNDGWIQGASYQAGEGYCMAGAMLTACGAKIYPESPMVDTNVFSEDAYRTGMDLIAKALGLKDENQIPGWNDTPGRTKNQVIDAMMAAIITHYNAAFV